MKSQPRVCCYVRVSTDDQTTDSQEGQLKEYCERRGWTKRVGWFKDYASGAKRNRGALGVMMDEVREGTVDIVLTWKIDRLARSLNHLAQIIAELQTYNVALVCPSQGIDTTDSNPCAEFQINILAAVAQFERELIVERVKVGIAAAKQRGVKLGRPSNRKAYVDQIGTLLEHGIQCSANQSATDNPIFNCGRDRTGIENIACPDPFGLRVGGKRVNRASYTLAGTTSVAGLKCYQQARALLVG